MSGSPEKMSAEQIVAWRRTVDEALPHGRFYAAEMRRLLDGIDALQAENEALRKVRDAARECFDPLGRYSTEAEAMHALEAVLRGLPGER